MAAKGEEVQLLDEWQHLSSSSSSSSYPPSPKWHDSLLIHNNYVLQEESVFHPSLHENLDHVPLPKPPMFSSSSFVDSSSDDVQQQLVVVPLDNKSKEDGFRVVYLRSCSLIGAVGAIYRVVCNWSFLGWGAWALVSALATAGIVAVAVMSWAYAKFRKLKCLRLKRSRVKEESAVMENLVLLVKQKEELAFMFMAFGLVWETITEGNRNRTPKEVDLDGGDIFLHGVTRRCLVGTRRYRVHHVDA